jgi:hypothetical protein
MHAWVILAALVLVSAISIANALTRRRKSGRGFKKADADDAA